MQQLVRGFDLRQLLPLGHVSECGHLALLVVVEQIVDYEF